MVIDLFGKIQARRVVCHLNDKTQCPARRIPCSKSYFLFSENNKSSEDDGLDGLDFWSKDINDSISSNLVKPAWQI
jgi:hypothetical protein